MASRFTKVRKEEMLEGFRSGKSLSTLAKDFGCTPATVTRIVKAFLSDDEFLDLKKARKRTPGNQDQASSLEKKSNISNEFKEKGTFNSGSLKDEFLEKNFSDSSSLDELGEESLKTNVIDNDFQELVPLVTNFEWDNQKELACQPFTPDLLPSTVFMLVDKTVELESKSLKEFSQWSFLPEKDQNRLVIVLFSNQRSAKRSCSRTQRVLKVPNTSVFQFSLPHLLSKGITRLILDDSLIAIDN